MNGDGKLDLITSFYSEPNPLASGLAIGFGNGDGTFQSPVLYDAGTDTGASGLILADFNFDGIPDAALIGEDGVWIYIGTGKGAFAPGNLVSVTRPSYGGGGMAITAADLNGDGKVDLVAGNQSGFVLLLGNGDGTFQPPVQNTQVPFTGGLLSADLNGDGKADLIVTSTKSNTVLILFGAGNGTFSPPVTLNLPNGLSFALGDLNGDGKLDVMTDYGYVAFGQGRGKFSAPVYYPNGTGNELLTTAQIVLADLRNSGHLDAVTATFDGIVSVLLNQGNGTFTEATYLTASQPACPTIADFNGDGKSDLAVVVGGAVSIYLGTGKAATLFLAPASIAIPGTFCLAAGDFNHDGKTDLVVLSNGTGSNVAVITTLLGNGDGTFTQKAVLNSPVALGSAKVADFNRDGKLDLVFTGNLVTFGNGDGTFGPLLPLSTGLPALNPAATAITVADFNGDKFPDVALVDPFNNTIYILLNQGKGTFNLSLLSSLPGGATNAVAADINGDGRPDLVCSTDPGGIEVFLGNGDGTFTPGATISIPLYPAESLIVADLNGDGILDIAQANNTSLAVFQGNGDGTFQTSPNPLFGLGPSPGAMVTADLHGQSAYTGLPDIVITDSTGAIGILVNTTPH